jgi:hypothetical protein
MSKEKTKTSKPKQPKLSNALLGFSLLIHGCNVRKIWLFRLGSFGFLLTHAWVQRWAILVVRFTPFLVFSSLIHECNARQFWLFRLGPFGFLHTHPWVHR